MQVDSWLVSVADSNTRTTLLQTLHVNLPIVWKQMVFVHDLLIGLLSSLKEPLREKKKTPENPKMLSLFSVLLVETYLSTLANSTLIILFSEML